MGRRFSRLTTAARLRVKDCPAGNEYKYRLLAAAVGRIQKGRPLMTKPGSRPEGRWKYYTTSLALAEMHPFWCWRTTFPPEGALLAALCFVMFMRSKGKRRANLPLRGGKRTKFVGSRKATENFVRRFPVERRRRQKGCISNRRSLVCMFSLRTKGVIFQFYRKRRPHISGRPPPLRSSL